jgi:formate-dependent nitrite reductase membrane component NrfD
MVPDATPTSYYGRPILKKPTWHEPDIPGYFFLGGLAGGSSVIAAGAQLTGRDGLARVAKVGALGAISLSTAALIHDLGRPSRFVNMLRVFKPTSPMSVGSWLLAGYGPAAGAAALSELTGLLPGVGTAATVGGAVLGPAIATYTAVLVANTAVPAWHEARLDLPIVFAASAASAAAGWGLMTAPAAQHRPVGRLAVIAAAVDVIGSHRMIEKLGPVGLAYRQGRAGTRLRAATALTTAGAALVAVGGRSAKVRRVGGLALLLGSAATRFGIFSAGVASAEDPAATVDLQRSRR